MTPVVPMTRLGEGMRVGLAWAEGTPQSCLAPAAADVTTTASRKAMEAGVEMIPVAPMAKLGPDAPVGLPWAIGTPDACLARAAAPPASRALSRDIEAWVEMAAVPTTAGLDERPQTGLVPGPPARRGRMRVALRMRDPGAPPLLDPFTCPFGGQEDVWEPRM
jgi:hypothetical protein